MIHELKEPIPHYYKHWSERNGKLFKAYVKAYVEKNYQGWELVRIEDKGKVAVIRRVD